MRLMAEAVAYVSFFGLIGWVVYLYHVEYLARLVP